MPYMGFEPTIPASEQAKTVHALDRSATSRVLVSNNSGSELMRGFINLLYSLS
jgi:hypothetical protein